MSARVLALIALAALLLTLCGCGYTVVEDRASVAIGTGDTYVAPRETLLFEDDGEPGM